jgi:hypothetical protein
MTPVAAPRDVPFVFEVSGVIDSVDINGTVICDTRDSCREQQGLPGRVENPIAVPIATDTDVLLTVRNQFGYAGQRYFVSTTP